VISPVELCRGWFLPGGLRNSGRCGISRLGYADGGGIKNGSQRQHHSHRHSASMQHQKPRLWIEQRVQDVSDRQRLMWVRGIAELKATRGQIGEQRRMCEPSIATPAGIRQAFNCHSTAHKPLEPGSHPGTDLHPHRPGPS